MDKKKIQKAVKDILEAIGEDPQREGLKNTPSRVANMYEEIFGGAEKDPNKELEVFFEKEHDEIILLKDIPLYSVCEHHMVPFVGKARGQWPDCEWAWPMWWPWPSACSFGSFSAKTRSSWRANCTRRIMTTDHLIGGLCSLTYWSTRRLTSC